MKIIKRIIAWWKNHKNTIAIDDIDPWTGEPFEFTVTNDMIWDPQTKELFLPSGEPMPDVPWLKFEDVEEEVMI